MATSIRDEDGGSGTEGDVLGVLGDGHIDDDGVGR